MAFVVALVGHLLSDFGHFPLLFCKMFLIRLCSCYYGRFFQGQIRPFLGTYLGRRGGPGLLGLPEDVGGAIGPALGPGAPLWTWP